MPDQESVFFLPFLSLFLPLKQGNEEDNSEGRKLRSEEDGRDREHQKILQRDGEKRVKETDKVGR